MKIKTEEAIKYSTQQIRAWVFGSVLLGFTGMARRKSQPEFDAYKIFLLYTPNGSLKASLY